MFSLQGKTAFITGSGRGIGAAIARAFLKQGAAVNISDINHDLLGQTVEKLRSEFPQSKVNGIVCDVTKQADIDAAMDKMSASGLEILVNNAAINLRAPLDQITDEMWQRMLDTNVTSVFRVSRAALPLLKKQGGKVINLCSLMSEIARPTVSPYATTKGAVRQFTRALATEWARYNIQVNGIAPGFIATEMNVPIMEDEELNSYIMRHTPAKRWGTTEEVASVAAFLASPASNFVTGQVIFIDGGFMASL